MPFDPGPDHVQDDPPFGALHFTVDEVQSVLLKLEVGSPDGISPLILKNCAPAVVHSLSLSLLYYLQL
jgi:hypothetical protein